MKLRNWALVVLLISLLQIPLWGRSRKEIKIPDISGYVTLKCDFHMHTMFSDGDVWPTVRVDEAWSEGLDAISITDHIEYQPHKKDVPTNHNRPYEIALDRAKSLNIILIKGAEITRDMPPGHFNAIFVKDIEKLDVKKWQDAIKAAIEQGAFVFWNHPGWRQPNEIPIWYDEHTEIFNNGWMHGLEIVNEKSYYPLAFTWGLEKDLTLLGNTDIHSLVSLEYPVQTGGHRPMTLVFAKDRSAKAIHEALKAGRTAVYRDKTIMGKADFLEPLFQNSIKIENSDITLNGRDRNAVRIYNNSEIEFTLSTSKTVDGLEFPETLVIEPGKTTLLLLRAQTENMQGKREITLPYSVINMKTGPASELTTAIKLNITFIPR